MKVNTMSNDNLADFSDLEEINLEDLPELPDYCNPPTGAYVMQVSEVKRTKKDDSDTLRITMVIKEVVELADSAAVAPVLESLCSTQFNLNNEYGMGNLRKALEPLKAAWGTSNVAELLGKLSGSELKTDIKSSSSKKKDGSGTSTFTNVTAFNI